MAGNIETLVDSTKTMADPLDVDVDDDRSAYQPPVQVISFEGRLPGEEVEDCVLPGYEATTCAGLRYAALRLQICNNKPHVSDVTTCIAGETCVTYM